LLCPFHWNDVFGDDLAINAVTSDAIDPISMQPDFKFSAVALTRLSGPVVIEEIADDTAARTSSSREPAMSVPASAAPSIADALATFLRLPPAPIELSMTEQHYMGGFTQGLRMQASPNTPFPSCRTMRLSTAIAAMPSTACWRGSMRACPRPCRWWRKPPPRLCRNAMC
jgi:sulfite reductase (NADPH) flavoprotein alpha-component